MFRLATARAFILLSLVAAFSLTGTMYSLRSKWETHQTKGSPSTHFSRSGIRRNVPAAKHHHPSTVLHSRKLLVSMKSIPKIKLPVAGSILSPIMMGRSMAFTHPGAAQQAHKKAAHHPKTSPISTSPHPGSVTAKLANPSPHNLKLSTGTSSWLKRGRRMKKEHSLKSLYELDHAFHVDYSRPGAHPPHNH